MVRKYPEIKYRKDYEGQSDYENYIGTIKNGSQHGDKDYILYTTDESFDTTDTLDLVNLVVSAKEVLAALKEIVKCEENRMKDLRSLSMKPKSLYTFSKQRLEKAQAAIKRAEGF